MSAGLSTTMLKTEATMNPATCTPTPSPKKAISSETTAPREKKSRKKETLRSSPAKARAANTAQKTMSKLSKLRRPPLHRFYTNLAGDAAPDTLRVPAEADNHLRLHPVLRSPKDKRKDFPYDRRIREGPRWPAQGRPGGRPRPERDEGEPRTGDDYRRARRRRRAGLREVRGAVCAATGLRVSRRKLH